MVSVVGKRRYIAQLGRNSARIAAAIGPTCASTRQRAASPADRRRFHCEKREAGRADGILEATIHRFSGARRLAAAVARRAARHRGVEMIETERRNLQYQRDATDEAALNNTTGARLLRQLFASASPAGSKGRLT